MKKENMNTLTMEQLLKDVQQISHQHYQRWSGNGLVQNDIESEAVDWAWPKFDKLQAMHAENPNGYKKYLNTGLKWLLDRFCQEELVRSRMLSNNADHDNSGYSGYNGYTYMSAKRALEKKDAQVFAVADSACTAKQLAALEGKYLQELSWEEVAVLLGVKRQTVHSAIDRAIHNIVSRSAGR